MGEKVTKTQVWFLVLLLISCEPLGKLGTTSGFRCPHLGREGHQKPQDKMGSACGCKGLPSLSKRQHTHSLEAVGL